MNRKIVKFSDNIKILRNKTGLSQEQMAEIFPVSRQTVSAWEKNISSPDIATIAKMSEVFNMTTDELIFGKLSKEKGVVVEIINDEENEKDFIRTIEKKGFYDIIEEDLQTFFPIIPLRFSRIMGIAMELKENGYQIVSVYSNGFSIYFPTDESAIKFSSVLYDIIDSFIHYEKERTAFSYSETIQERIDQVEISIIKETHKAIFGADIDDMFYWVDEYDTIRGYGKTKEDCTQQANEQNCKEYTILHE